MGPPILPRPMNPMRISPSVPASPLGYQARATRGPLPSPVCGRAARSAGEAVDAWQAHAPGGRTLSVSPADEGKDNKPPPGNPAKAGIQYPVGSRCACRTTPRTSHPTPPVVPAKAEIYPAIPVSHSRPRTRTHVPPSGRIPICELLHPPRVIPRSRCPRHAPPHRVHRPVTARTCDRSHAHANSHLRSHRHSRTNPNRYSTNNPHTDPHRHPAPPQPGVYAQH